MRKKQNIGPPPPPPPSEKRKKVSLKKQNGIYQDSSLLSKKNLKKVGKIWENLKKFEKIGKKGVKSGEKKKKIGKTI